MLLYHLPPDGYEIGSNLLVDDAGEVIGVSSCLKELRADVTQCVVKKHISDVSEGLGQLIAATNRKEGDELRVSAQTSEESAFSQVACSKQNLQAKDNVLLQVTADSAGVEPIRDADFRVSKTIRLRGDRKASELRPRATNHGAEQDTQQEEMKHVEVRLGRSFAFKVKRSSIDIRTHRIEASNDHRTRRYEHVILFPVLLMEKLLQTRQPKQQAAERELSEAEDSSASRRSA